MSAWLPKVVEPSKQQGLAAVFFLILYPYYLIRGKVKVTDATQYKQEYGRGSFEFYKNGPEIAPQYKWGKQPLGSHVKLKEFTTKNENAWRS